jgi:hypothetical protein
MRKTLKKHPKALLTGIKSSLVYVEISLTSSASQKVRGKNCSMLNQKWGSARCSVSDGNISSRQQKRCMLNQKWVLASISVSGNKMSSQPAEIFRAESEMGFSQKFDLRQ